MLLQLILPKLFLLNMSPRVHNKRREPFFYYELLISLVVVHITKSRHGSEIYNDSCSDLRKYTPYADQLNN